MHCATYLHPELFDVWDDHAPRCIGIALYRFYSCLPEAD